MLAIKRPFLAALCVAFAEDICAQAKHEVQLDQAQYRIIYNVKAVTGSVEKDSAGSFTKTTSADSTLALR